MLLRAGKRAVWRRVLGVAAVAVLMACGAAAQTSGANAARAGWLRYAIPPDPPRYHDMPHAVVLLGDAAGQVAPEEQTAADELDRGLGHMVAGTDVLSHRFDPRVDAIVLGTTDALRRARINRLPGWTDRALPEEGFRIVHLRRGVRNWWVLQGGSPRAEMFAAFRFASLVAEDQQLPNDLNESPKLALRAVEFGDDASVLAELMEKQQGEALSDVLPRLLASVGMNAVIVSADAAQAERIAAVIRPYGMRLWVRLDVVPDTVALNSLEAALPNLGGVVLPASTPAAAVNATARTLRRDAAAVMLRNAAERDTRAAGVAALSPGLEPNVIETGAAVSPLLPVAGLGSSRFGTLPGVPQAAEFDLLPPLRQVLFPLQAWQSALITPEHGLHGDTTMASVLGADAPAHSAVAAGGVVGRLRAGDATRVLEQPLLAANLYAFGRMAWSPAAGADAIVEEWARQTFGDDARVYGVAQHLLLRSREVYAGDNAPMGLPSLADASGETRPEDAAQRVGLADRNGIGTERGASEMSRYPTSFAALLEDAERCPDAWLLAVHRLPYSHRLRDGKTLVQAIYDTYFAGAAQAANAVDAWETTHGLVDEDRYRLVHALLEEAARGAEIARERSTEWLLRVSGVPDATGFVGSHSGRVEAEAMELNGFTISHTAFPDDASRGALVTCGAKTCSAATVFHGEENVYRVEIGYFDEATAPNAFELRVNRVARAAWKSEAANGYGNSAEGEMAPRRFIANGIRLKPGDRVEARGVPATGGHAALDFVEITRDPRWN